MKVEKISELTTDRLSTYLRCLIELEAKGLKTVSSETLASTFHLNSAQIRKDLAYFGEFGVRGVGYYIETLIDHLRKILGIGVEHNICIIGSGRLGTALAHYHGLKHSNFHVKALFDSDKKKIGKKIGGIQIFDIKTFQSVAKKHNIDIAVIAVPGEYAQTAVEAAAKAGIKAVMNFAPVPLKAPDGVKVRTVDMTTCLESMSFFLSGMGSTTNASESKKAKSKTTAK